MNRKEFFNKSCQCGIASLIGLLFFPKDSIAGTHDNLNQKEIEKLKNDINFTQHRFSDLLKHLENFINKESRLQLYQNLGESCADLYVDQLTPLKGNLNMMLAEQLKQDWLQDYTLNESEGTLDLIGKPKEKCGCPLVHKGLTPKEFCNCSLGHMKKIYEVVMEKKVEVEIKKSILMGDEQCNFTIKFSN
jgi:hypothetical protein